MSGFITFTRYIENRGKEIMAMYKKNSNRKDIIQLKENLKQAIVIFLFV